MTDFTLHTVDSAPDASKALLEDSQKSLGFVPNLHAVMAESPQVLEAYKDLSALFSATSLTAAERNVVWLAINVEHNCHYCVPAHSVIAGMQGVDEATITALRDATPLPDPKLEALRAFTLQVVRGRGIVSDADIQAFLEAGYDRHQILDVILGVSHKVLSNYVNHFADTPVDEAFASRAWTPKIAEPAE